MFKDPSVLVQRINQAHGPSIYAPNGSQGRQIQRQENIGDEFGREQVQPARRILWLAVVPPVVEGTASLKAGIVQGVVDDS